MMKKFNVENTKEEELKIAKELYATSQIEFEKLKAYKKELEVTIYDLTSIINHIKVLTARIYASNKKSKPLKELATMIIETIDNSKHKDKF